MYYYSLSRVTQPAELAVSLSEAKEYLKIDHNAEDALLEKFIKSIVLKFENYTNLSLICHSWQVTYRQTIKESVTLPISPSVRINKVNLISFKNDVQAYDINNCLLDKNIDEVYFQVIPFSYLLKIEFTAGFGYQNTDVPEDIKVSILKHLALAYEHRTLGVNFSYSIYDAFKKVRL